MVRSAFISVVLICLSLPAVPAAGQEEELFAGAPVLEREPLLAAVTAIAVVPRDVTAR